jgi:hypothetical protein
VSRPVAKPQAPRPPFLGGATYEAPRWPPAVSPGGGEKDGVANRELRHTGKHPAGPPVLLRSLYKASRPPRPASILLHRERERDRERERGHEPEARDEPHGLEGRRVVLVLTGAVGAEEGAGGLAAADGGERGPIGGGEERSRCGGGGGGACPGANVPLLLGAEHLTWLLFVASSCM